MILLLLALGTAWDALRAVAWHGWAALEIYTEAVLALAVAAIVAGVRRDTAKAYSTEHRVNELTRRSWSRIWPDPHNVGNDSAPRDLSARYTIKAGEAVAGSEYEVYIEGNGHWETAAGSSDVQFRLAAFGTQFDTFNINRTGGFAAGQGFEFWLSATITMKTATDAHHHIHGAMWRADGPRDQNTTMSFGRDQSGTSTVTSNVDSELYVLGNFTQVQPGQLLSSYKTRITRRGA